MFSSPIANGLPHHDKGFGYQILHHRKRSNVHETVFRGDGPHRYVCGELAIVLNHSEIKLTPGLECGLSAGLRVLCLLIGEATEVLNRTQETLQFLQVQERATFPFKSVPTRLHLIAQTFCRRGSWLRFTYLNRGEGDCRIVAATEFANAVKLLDQYDPSPPQERFYLSR
jgi:hypothetical protein